MDKNNQQILGFDYPDLDLSSDDDQGNKNIQKQEKQQPKGQPTKKVKLDQTSQDNKTFNNQKQIKTFPPPGTGLPFFPPPPGLAPPSSKTWVPPPPSQIRPYIQSNPSNIPQSRSQPYKQYNANQNNRHYNHVTDKRTVIYVRNIPKLFNTKQKLTTFFQNQGLIKQVQPRPLQHTATIRFVKQQQCLKFLKSNKIIFNRSFIIYSDDESIKPTEQQIRDRVTDQQGVLKKQELTNQKVLKEKASFELAQQIRVLYFLQNWINEEIQQANSSGQIIKTDLASRVAYKRSYEDEKSQFIKPSDQFMNKYNYQIKIKRSSPNLIQKKSLFPQFLKYGMIANLESSYQIVQNKIQAGDGEGEQVTQIYFYEIKILFLGPKILWKFYSAVRDSIQIEFQSTELKKIFDSGHLKVYPSVELQMISAEQNQQIQQENTVNVPQQQKPEVINFGLNNQQQAYESQKIDQTKNQKDA